MKKIEKKYPLKQIWSFDTFELTTDNINNLVKNYKSFIRILNTLRSRIWDMVVFLFSDYSKSTVGENGGLNTNSLLRTDSR